MKWLTQYWFLWAILAQLIAYEWYSLAAGHPEVWTISLQFWTAIKDYPWFTPIFFSTLAVLCIHFWFPNPTRWTTAFGWTMTATLVTQIWAIYAQLRAV